MRISKIKWLLLVVIIVAQAKAYLSIWPLSLGPRVVLQPWLMRQGYLLYVNIADEHAPLMYLWLLAIQPLTPNSLEAAKLTLVGLISISVLLTFWAGQQNGGWLSGLFSALFFALWSPLFGYSKLWHETFLAPIYTLLLIFWCFPTQRRFRSRMVLIGFLSGIALLIKQHALAVIFSVIFWRFLKHRRSHLPIRYLFSEMAWFSIGLLLPVSIFTVYYWLKAKALQDLVFWLITFNFINRYIQLAALWPSVDQVRLLIPAYLLVPSFLANLLNQRGQRNGEEELGELGLILLVTTSLTALPRFGFFHLQASLPILAWMSGTTLARLAKIQHSDIINRKILWLLRGLVCSFLLLWAIYPNLSLYKALRSFPSRQIYEYSNLIPLANEIRQRIGPTDCIYVLPDDEATANLYYLTQCLPPQLWVPTSYPWFMVDAIKPRLMRALENAAPKWVIYFPGRWGIEQHGQDLLNYVQNNYRIAAKLFWPEGEVWVLKRLSLDSQH